MRLRRINSIRGNDDHIIQTLTDNTILKWSSLRYYDNISFSSNINIKQYHTDYLINLINVPHINNWYKSPTTLLTSIDFVDSFKLKHALLYTKFREKRMFPNIKN